MTTAAPPTLPQTELVYPSLKPLELSFPLPKALHTTAHVHLTFLDHCVMAFLTTSTPGDSAGSVKPLGSFVYAMPDVSSLNPLHALLVALSCQPCFEIVLPLIQISLHQATTNPPTAHVLKLNNIHNNLHITIKY